MTGTANAMVEVSAAPEGADRLNAPEEALGVSEPPAEYADYPEACAAPNRPSVSQPEPPTIAVQTPVSTVTDNTGVRSVVTDEASTEFPVSVEAVAVASTPEITTVELHGDESREDNSWHMMLSQLKLSGMAQQLAEHCLFKSQADGKVILLLERSGETLLTTRTERALTEALQHYFAEPVRPEFEVVDAIGETPEKRRIRLRAERQAAAERAIADDPIVQQLRQKWGGRVIPGSVRPNKDVDAS